MKKLLAMVLATVMVLGISATAFAKAPAKITPDGNWMQKNGDKLTANTDTADDILFTADKDDYMSGKPGAGAAAKTVLKPDNEIRLALDDSAIGGDSGTYEDVKFVVKSNNSATKAVIASYGMVKSGGVWYAYIKFNNDTSTKLIELDFDAYFTKKSSSTKMDIDTGIITGALSNINDDNNIILSAYSTPSVAGGTDKGLYFGNGILAVSEDDVELDAADVTATPVVDFKKGVKNITIEGDNFSFVTDAAKQGKVYVKAAGDVDEILKTVLKANDNAKVTVIRFPGKPDYDFSGDLKLFPKEYDQDKTYYAYSVADDGKLTEVGKWNKDDECFDVRTRSLNRYLISDMKLAFTPAASSGATSDVATSGAESATSKDEGKTNPGMGANDMVGVAVALAVVSVAAAGAVALKK